MEKDVEYPHKGYAKVRIFINDLYIGNFETVAYLNTFISGFYADINRLELLPRSCYGMIPEEVFIKRFDRRETDDYKEDIDHFNIISDETFDDFALLAYRLNDEEIIVLWRLYEDTNYEYEDYPEGIHKALINLDYVKNTLKKADIFLRESQW